MKYVEVKEQATAPDSSSPAGIYLVGGTMHVALGNGLYPYAFPTLQVQEMVNSVSAGGISEETMLKAMALALDKSLAKKVFE